MREAIVVGDEAKSPLAQEEFITKARTNRQSERTNQDPEPPLRSLLFKPSLDPCWRVLNHMSVM